MSGEINKRRIKSTHPNFWVILGFFALSFFCFLYFLNFYHSQKAKAANAPSIITYQGKLLVGGYLATTTQSMTFELFTALEGGSAIYSSSTSVTPSQGLFSVDLSIDPIYFKNNTSIYLQVTIGSEQLSPRKQITASPYAFNARYLDGVGTATISSSVYIPLSNSIGNFTFNSTTITTSSITDLIVGNSVVLPADSISSTHLQSTAVQYGTYGSSTHVGSFIVDADGRLTFATSSLISITSNQVSGIFATTSLASEVVVEGENISLLNNDVGYITSSSAEILTNKTWNGSVIGISYGGTATSSIGTAGSLVYSNGNYYDFTAIGTAGYLLQANGSSAPSWVSTTSLTVGTANNANTLDGLASSSFLLVLNNLSDLNNFATARSNLGLSIGSDVQAWDADLDAMSALSSIGFAVRTSSNEWILREVTSTDIGRISVINGNGVSGNPTIDLSASGVGSGVYGSAANVPQLTVDAYGRITSANNVAIAINGNQITSGVVSTSYGGTGQDSSVWDGYARITNGVWSTSTINLAGNDVSGVLNVANGGTGTSTLISGAILYGNGTSEIGATVGNAGYILLSGGAGVAPSWVNSTTFAFSSHLHDSDYINVSGDAMTGALYIDNILSVSATTTLATTTGMVGIGTSTPLAKLDVYGNMILSGENRLLNFSGTTGASGYGIRDNNGTMEYKNDSGSWVPFSAATGYWTQNPDSSIYYNIAGVAIGTTTPETGLDVWGSASFGSSTSTEIVFRGYVQSNIIPYIDATYALGSSGNRWSNIYSVTGTFGGTTVIGTDSITANGTSVWSTTAGSLTLQSAGSLTVSSTGSTGFNVNGHNNAMYILDNGYIGIGTGSPVAQLDINGGKIALNGGWLTFDGTPDEGLVVAAGGRVGIGQGAPNNLLHILAADNSVSPRIIVETPSSTETVGLQLSSTGENWHIIKDSSGGSLLPNGLLFRYNTGDPALAINTNGYLGVNVTSPERRAHIIDNTGNLLRLGYDSSHYADFLIGPDGALTVSSTDRTTTTFNSNVAISYGSTWADYPKLTIGNVELRAPISDPILEPDYTYFYIDNGSSLFMSQNDTRSGGSYYDTFGFSNDDGGIIFSITATSSGDGAIHMTNSSASKTWQILNGGTSGDFSIGTTGEIGTTSTMMFIDYETGNIGINTTTPSTTLFVNGTAGGTSAYSDYSDERLKSNIITIPNALSKINSLRGVEFDWKDPSVQFSPHSIGLIAQETLPVLPQVVNDLGGVYGIQYGPIVGLLVEGIKEQNSQLQPYYQALTINTSSNFVQIGYNTSTYNLKITGNLNFDNSSSSAISFNSSGLFESSVSVTTSPNVFVFNSNGYGSTASDKYLLSVRNDGISKFSISANGDVKTAGAYYGTNLFLSSSTNPGDLAERVDIAIDDNVESGDVVRVDSESPDTYRRSDAAYQDTVAGVISTNPTIVVGNGKTEYTAVMAMVGRVPVKVTNENGMIKRGDLLVSASKAGYAMRYDPAKDPGKKLVAVIGIALEPFTGAQGKILSLIRSSWVYNRDQTISNIQNNIQQLASIQGVDLSDNESGLLTVKNDSGQINYSGGNLNLTGNLIINVRGIVAQNNKWYLDTDGNLVQRIATDKGVRETYSLQSGNKRELVLSGSSQLENGQKKIELSELDQEIVDKTVPLKITITMSDQSKGVYVPERDYKSFTAKENEGGNSNAKFDWIVIAKIKEADTSNNYNQNNDQNNTNNNSNNNQNNNSSSGNSNQPANNTGSTTSTSTNNNVQGESAQADADSNGSEDAGYKTDEGETGDQNQIGADSGNEVGDSSADNNANESNQTSDSDSTNGSAITPTSPTPMNSSDSSSSSGADVGIE